MELFSRRWVAAASVALVMGLLAGPALAADKALKIGLICSGSTSDGGWNQSAKEALDKLKRELGAQTSVIEKVSADKAAAEIREYAADGYDLVIGHGYEFLNPAEQVAKNVGTTKLAVSGADKNSDRILTMDYDVSQASYQLGIIAGKTTKTGKLAFIGGSPIPAVKACYRGFSAGAKSVNPNVTVSEAYTSWDQPELSKSQAEAFLKSGVDVIFQNVDAASRGVFEAVKEANKGGVKVYVFGCNRDQNQNPVCPDATLASAVIKLDVAFTQAAKSVQNGSFRPGVVRENLANGVCVTVLNPKLIGTAIAPATVVAVEAAGKKLAAGEITIPAE